MKNKKSIIIGLVLGIIIMALYLYIIPIIHENNCKSRVYDDMKKQEDIIKKSIVGIMPESETDGLKTRGGFGSGVIFNKVDNVYYAITAKHVVDDKNSSYKLFTINTKFSGETIEAGNNISIEVPDENYYESLIDVKLEYMSDSTDLAIISFISDEDLPVLEFEEKEINIGDKIMCIGHPEGHKYYVSFGTITSNIKNIAFSKSNKNEKPTSVIEHNAYLNQGNSGGVAISKNMKIVGINVGGAFTITGKFSNGYMIPNTIVKENISKYNKSKDNSNDLKLSDNWSSDKVKMSMKNISKESAILAIEDKNDIPTSWDTKYSIQRLSEANVWYDMKTNVSMENLMKVMSPNDAGITEIPLDWKDMYGELKKGTYRIVKNKNFITLYSESFNIE